MDTYRTIRREGQDEFVERRSRFIGAICPVTTEQQAIAFINDKKKAHWDATHNVYAYILREGQVRRYSDDGEPQGTAGIPVLDVLQKSGLTGHPIFRRGAAGRGRAGTRVFAWCVAGGAGRRTGGDAPLHRGTDRRALRAIRLAGAVDSRYRRGDRRHRFHRSGDGDTAFGGYAAAAIAAASDRTNRRSAFGFGDRPHLRAV